MIRLPCFPRASGRSPGLPRRRTLAGWLFLTAGLALPLLGAGLGGCNVLGFLGTLAPDRIVTPAYSKLKGQTVLVAVWADNLTLMNYPDVQARLANAIEGTFKKVLADKEAGKDLEGMRFLPNEIALKYLQRFPASTHQEMAKAMAGRGATRLMVIDLKTFETHTAISEDTYRGVAVANVYVYELAGKAPAVQVSEGYSVADVQASYPPNNPVGTTNTDAESVINETVREFSENLSLRFISHPETKSGNPGNRPEVGQSLKD